RNGDLARTEAVVADSQVRLLAREVLAVVALTGHSQRSGHSSRTGGNQPQVAIALYDDIPSRRHLFDSGQRFHRAKQDCAGDAFALARHVQAVMISINEVDIGEPGGAEHDRIARRLADIGVRSRIVLAQVRFGFDDAYNKRAGGRFSHQQFSKQRPGYATRIAVEEILPQPLDFSNRAWPYTSGFYLCNLQSDLCKPITRSFSDTPAL